MRCYICDVVLYPHEIERDVTGLFKPCGRCLSLVSELREEDDEERIEISPSYTLPIL